MKFFTKNNSAERQLQFVNEVQIVAKRANKELGLPPNSHAKLVKELLEPVERKVLERKPVEQQKSGKLSKKQRKFDKMNRYRLEPRVSQRLKEKVQKELPTSFKIYDVSTNKIQEIPILPDKKSDEKRLIPKTFDAQGLKDFNELLGLKRDAKIPIETLRNKVALERPKKLSKEMERKNLFVTGRKQRKIQKKQNKAQKRVSQSLNEKERPKKLSKKEAERKNLFVASRQQYAQERQQFFINFQRENGRPAEMSEWVAHHAFVNQRD